LRIVQLDVDSLVSGLGDASARVSNDATSP